MSSFLQKKGKYYVYRYSVNRWTVSTDQILEDAERKWIEIVVGIRMWTKTLKADLKNLQIFTLPKSVPHFRPCIIFSLQSKQSNKTRARALARYYTQKKFFLAPLFLCVAMACSDCLFVCVCVCRLFPSIERNKSETTIFLKIKEARFTRWSLMSGGPSVKPPIHPLFISPFSHAKLVLYS